MLDLRRDLARSSAQRTLGFAGSPTEAVWQRAPASIAGGPLLHGRGLRYRRERAGEIGEHVRGCAGDSAHLPAAASSTTTGRLGPSAAARAARQPRIKARAAGRRPAPPPGELGEPFSPRAQHRQDGTRSSSPRAAGRCRRPECARRSAPAQRQHRRSGRRARPEQSRSRSGQGARRVTAPTPSARRARRAPTGAGDERVTGAPAGSTRRRAGRPLRRAHIHRGRV